MINEILYVILNNAILASITAILIYSLLYNVVLAASLLLEAEFVW